MIDVLARAPWRLVVLADAYGFPAVLALIALAWLACLAVALAPTLPRTRS